MVKEQALRASLETMNVLQKAVSLLEITGPDDLPYIKMSFRTVEEMQAASDYIRLLAEPLSTEVKERGLQSLLADVMKDLPAGKETNGG